MATVTEGTSTVAQADQTLTRRSLETQKVRRPAASDTTSITGLSGAFRQATWRAGARLVPMRRATSPGASAWNTATAPQPETVAMRSSPRHHAVVAKPSRVGRPPAAERGRATWAEYRRFMVRGGVE